MLVITIIVMIILATVIILSLDSSNIIERANEAKQATNLANAKEIVALAKAEWELDKETLSTEYASVEEYLYEKLEEAGYKTEGHGAIMLSSSGAINTIYVGSDDRKAIIPDGFKASSKAAEDTVTEGLVITDNEGNEFVWVPVDDINEFVLRDGYEFQFTETENGYEYEFLKEQTLVSDGTVAEPYAAGYATEVEEYNAMYASVKEYGGFYIGRYEAGDGEATSARTTFTGERKVVCKKDAYVYNIVMWGPSMTKFDGTFEILTDIEMIETVGAVYLSQKMYENSKSVVSTLCYGVQWDAALQFIAETDAAYLTEYDTAKGNFTGTVKKTGYYEVNNIYDMAGNVMEWTMEAIGSSERAVRGESLAGIGYGVGARMAVNPATQVNNNFDEGAPLGFRVTLYIK